MKTFLLGTVAAVGLALGFSPGQASAYRATRTVYHWDPACCKYVACQERYWVPNACNGRVYYRDAYRPYWERWHHDRYYHPFPH
jgi:hypothetical protein